MFTIAIVGDRSRRQIETLIAAQFVCRGVAFTDRVFARRDCADDFLRGVVSPAHFAICCTVREADARYFLVGVNP